MGGGAKPARLRGVGVCVAMTFAVLTGCSLLVSTSDLDESAQTPNAVVDGGSETSSPSPNPDGAANVLESGGNAGDAADAAITTSEPCPSFALFCDDFESGTVTKWSSIHQANSGSVTIVSTQAHRGTKSMRAFATPTDAAYSQAELRYELDTPRTSGLFAVRAYVFMPAQLVNDTTIFKFRSTGADDANVKMQTSGVFMVDTDVGANPPSSEKFTAAAPPLGAWFCIEWRLAIGAKTGEGRQTLLLNNQTILDGPENTFFTTGWDTISVGLPAPNKDATTDVFYDDVVVADQPIGCIAAP